MRTLKLTVVIPVYNLEEILLDTIKSLVIENNGKYEIIFVNDGSTDKSLLKLEMYLKKYENFFLGYMKIINQSNRGVASARNRGLLEAKGEYILFLDGDDCLKKDAIKTYLNRISTDKGQIDIYFNGYEEYILQKNKKIKIIDYKDYYKIISEKNSGIVCLVKKLEKKIWICTGNALYNKKFLRKNKLYYLEQYKHGEDINFINKALFNAREVQFISQNFLEILIRSNSAMRSKFNKNFLDIIYSQKELEEYFIEKDKKKYEIINENLRIDRFNLTLSVVKKIFEEYNLNKSIKLIEEFSLIGEIKNSNINLKKVNLLKKIEFFLAKKNLYLYYMFTFLYKKYKR
ncbi:MAG: glycosyltransferase [Cetobacterium sp.]